MAKRVGIDQFTTREVSGELAILALPTVITPI
jgi:hypothetical protein